MKEEIKEILEDVKRHLDYVEATGQCSVRDNEMKAMYDYITNLQEENRQTKLLKERYQLEKENYKSRNEKAIEYIHNHQLVFELSSKKQIQYWFDMFYEDLLNILKGDDND